MQSSRTELRDWIHPATLVILVAGAVLSLFTWRSLTGEIEHASRSAFRDVVTESRNAIESRLDEYYAVLHGMQGLFHAHPTLGRREFKLYVDAVKTAKGLRSVRTFTFSKLVPHAARAAYEEAVRKDTSIDPRGYPGFAIRTSTARAEYLPIHLVEPFEASEAGFGLDIFEGAVRRASVELARDTGSLVASAPFMLVTSPAGGPGVSLRLAVYRDGEPLTSYESRRKAFVGVVSLTFLARDLAADIVARYSGVGLDLSAEDLGMSGERREPVPLYRSSAEPAGGEALFRARTPLDVGGRQWLLEFSAPQRKFISAGDAAMPWLALGGGLLITVLLAGLMGSLASARKRAQRMAAGITADLRVSQEQLADAHRRTEQLIETLPNPVFFKARDGRYLGVNRAWEAFFGVPRDAIVGRSVAELYPHRPDIARRLEEKDAALWQAPGTQVYEMPITLRDGQRRDTIYYKATFDGPDGGVAGLIGTIIDITERKQAERRRAMEHAVTRVLAEADTLTEAMPLVIRTICEAMDWHGGARWEYVAEDGVLRCREHWSVARPAYERYLAAIAALEFPPLPADGGLVRRAYTSGKAIWIADAATEPGFVRAALAAEAGVRGAFCFPVRLGDEVLGAIEFFHDDPRQPDHELLSIVQSIGSQIGQYIVRKQAEEAVRFVATHDALTGLPNRVMFGQRLDHALQQARRHQRRLAVLFVDLDRFKVINDTLGHDAGDALLREAARRLQACVRASDTVARLGGDEFVVLVEEISDPMVIAGLAQKLLGALAEGFALAGSDLHVTASIGASTFPDDAENAASLLKNADIAMYRAKEQGRNTFQFYSAQLNVHTMERLSLESDLRRALERGELTLHYQPQVELRTGRIVGVEALVRWRHGERGLIAPGTFIGIAEETGLVVPIGEWVLREACAAQHAWTKSGLPPLRMSVNLSPRQFLHGDLVRDVRRVLATTGCRPECLELEVTEGTVVREPERVVLLLREFRELGVRVAIDDFGTGYSSLAYLKRFPLDRLKIDRSFVQGVPGERGDEAITRAVITMAHSLGMTVVAEGVETRAQHDYLLAQRCDEYQGYFFSRPVEEAQLLALLRQRSLRLVE